MADDKKDDKKGISISVGGNVGGDVISSEGDIEVNKVSGDYVRGDQITTGDIKDSTGVSIGRGSTVSVSQTASEITLTPFELAHQAAEQLAISARERADVEHNLNQLEAEDEEEEPQQDRVDRYLDILADIAPPIVEVIVNAISNPGALISSGMKLAIETWKSARQKAK